MINNGHINTSIQKVGIPDFPDCIEHTTMLWDRIKTVKNNKSNELQVLSLDLENAYGSVRPRKQWSSFEFQRTLKISYQRTLNVPM